MAYDSTLDPSILARAEFVPIEDLLLAILRPALPGVDVVSLYRDDQTFPAVLVRRDGDWGAWTGDPRFIDTAQISIHALAQGVNADIDAAMLSEATRVSLRDAVNVEYPGIGHLQSVRMMLSPRRVSDWATSSGPVQYAELPTDVMRYQSSYVIRVRRPRDGSHIHKEP